MWRVIDLGSVDGYTMTNLYEAVGDAVNKGDSPNTVILNHPENIFVNIGYHQILEKEIDIKYARRMGFDLVRRTIGGGAILDGPWEQDYFVIMHSKSPECPPSIREFYGKFLKPPIYALSRFGLNATLRPPNDITVNGKKISGNGAITLDEVNVLAGDILLELPIELMMRIIKAPSEKFQDKVADSMEEWLTSLDSETGGSVERERVKEYIVEGFVEELEIELIPGKLTDDETKTLERLIWERKKEEWIYGKDLQYQNIILPEKPRRTKIKEGVTVTEAIYKADKMIRVILVAVDDHIKELLISGDFFTQPYIGAVSILEETLTGTPIEKNIILDKIEKTMKENGIRILGATGEDIATAILKAAGIIN